MAHFFEVTTDSTCDLYTQEIERLGIDVGRLVYTMTDRSGKVTEHVDDFRTPEDYLDFYDRLRRGMTAKTSILNVAAHEAIFMRAAKRGVKKLLHVSISYGLSPTADNASAAIETVRQQFPDIDYRVIESDTATIGEGIVVEAACKLRDEGKTLDEAIPFLDDFKMKLQHFIVADDLMYLKRGGRVGTTQAVFGSMLRVKPIIICDRTGRLNVWGKEMGAIKSFRRIISEFANYTLNRDYARAVVIHTDNPHYAEVARELFAAATGFDPEIRIMGPIIGAHVGPGSVAIGWTSNELRPEIGAPAPK